MSPPEFSLSAAPIQKQDAGDGGGTGGETATTTAAPEGIPVPEINVSRAITYNNGKEFRLDWVRNLQLSLIGSRRSTDGSFDEETVRAIAAFQARQPGATASGVDGKIGPTTRRQLEAAYPILLNTTVGSHLDSRVLVPAGTGEPERFNYWKGIIESSGAVFLTDPMAMNLLGIRGIKIADGSDAHQVGGSTLAAGTIYQTSSAQDFVNARAAGTTDDHMSGDHFGFDDMIISLWQDAEGNVHVRERIGNVDPNELYTDDAYGTGHLMDGQYAYQVGMHSTASSTHRDAVAGISDPDNVLRRNTRDDGRYEYRALRPTRNQEVWREHENNDRFVSEAEEETSRERVYDRNNRYVNDNFAMNIHSSRDNHPNSQACMNVPASQYLEFMNEVLASSNQSNVLYTLIDASKIENGLVVVSSGRP
jgi:hypothetical protein